jgi:SAM-dependent methyltransferase
VSRANAAGPWGAKASTLYDDAYARRYRAHDDELSGSEPERLFTEFLQSVCASFSSPIDVLDLGCGTGRFFWAVTGARSIVGLDASAPMLAEAERPYRRERITADLTLVNADLFDHDFGAGRFDLVYSIGVLAEHSPLNERVVANVHRWLKPNGRFAFSTVHPDSPSVPATVQRTLGRLALPATTGRMRRWLRDRLTARGMYADETHVHELLDRSWIVESLTRMHSEAHLHCLCVARKGAR